MKLIFVIFFGKIFLKKRNSINNFNSQNLIKPNFKNALINAFKKQKITFLKIGLTFLFMTFFVILLKNSNSLEGIKNYVKPITITFQLPASCVIPITTYILSPLVGATSIGALIRSNTINEYQAIIATLLGSLLMLPVFALRYSLPSYTAIFGIRLGLIILSVSTLISMFSKAVILLTFLFLV
jgi:hypothetical protein